MLDIAPGFSSAVPVLEFQDQTLPAGHGAIGLAAAAAGAMDLTGTVLVLLLAAAGVWVVVAFNRLVRHRNLLAEGLSGVDVQLKRRHNLIPNLVQTVKGYAAHEKVVLEDVTRLRDFRGGERTAEKVDRENALTDGLKRLFAVAEAYPDLKANRSFLDLQTQLADIEDQLQMARRYYNGCVRNFNILVESFPSNWVARACGFRREDFFQIVTTSERQAPRVEM